VVHERFDDSGLDEEAEVAVRILSAPAFTGPSLTTGLVTGTGLAGAGITIIGSGPQDPSGPCTVVQVPSGFWSCPLPVSASGTYSISVQQTWAGTGEPGGIAGPFTVRVDKDAPGLPVFTQPTGGQRILTQPTRFAGTGENGGRVEIFVDGTLVCTSGVSAGVWGCDAELADGDHAVQGIQWDAAGNAGGGTEAFGFAVGEQSATTPGPATPGGPAPPTADPTPAPSPTPTPSTTRSPTPPARTPIPTTPFFPPPVGGESGLPPGDTWGTPTDYGAAIPTVAASVERGIWPLGLGLAIGFVLLFALPLRLLVGVLHGRVLWRGRLAGRNRHVDEPAESPAPLLGPWVTAAGALGAAVLLAALAGGIQGEVRYLRLAIGIGIALFALNGVAVALTTKLTSRALGSVTGIRLVPLFLALAAVTALVSRTGGIQPPVIVGVVIAARFVVGLPARARGIVSVVEIGAITILGCVGWLAHSAIGPVEGFGPSLASETLAALCIAALGSAMVLLLPVSWMPGRLILEWSKAAWVAITLVAGTIAATVIAGSDSFPVAWMVGIALAFAAISCATWCWIRFVEPLARGRA
jgi:hypothetical protein